MSAGFHFRIWISWRLAFGIRRPRGLKSVWSWWTLMIVASRLSASSRTLGRSKPNLTPARSKLVRWVRLSIHWVKLVPIAGRFTSHRSKLKGQLKKRINRRWLLCLIAANCLLDWSFPGGCQLCGVPPTQLRKNHVVVSSIKPSVEECHSLPIAWGYSDGIPRHAMTDEHAR